MKIVHMDFGPNKIRTFSIYSIVLKCNRNTHLDCNVFLSCESLRYFQEIHSHCSLSERYYEFGDQINLTN